MSIVLPKHMPPDFIARRIRDNKWDALERALNDLVMDTDYPIDAAQIMNYVQCSLVKCQALFSETEKMYTNIQLINDVIDAIHPVTNLNCGTDGIIQRAEKLENLKIDIAKVKVMK